MTTLLVIDDDEFFHQLIKESLSSYTIASHFSGDNALKKIEQIQPQLIFLDIQMDGSDGFEVCRQLKNQPLLRDIPVMFISNLDNQEDRLKAYGLGAIDYISKPFNPLELATKVEQILQLKQRSDQYSKALKESVELVNEAQKTAAESHAINRFIQSTLFCHDITSLTRLFFMATRELHFSCVLRCVEDDEIYSSSPHYSKLEKEILTLSEQLPKIFNFGNQRAILNWPRAKLLVRNAGDKLDILALLMDALDAALHAIHNQNKIMLSVSNIQLQNSIVKDHINDEFNVMKQELQNTLISLGIVVELNPEEEDVIYDVLEKFEKRIAGKLDIFSQNHQSVVKLLEQQLQNSPEIESLLQQEAKHGGDIDDVLF